MIDYSRDYGNLVTRAPAAVRRPSTVGQLAAACRELTAARTPFKLRGAGHSASGEVLTPHTVIDLSRLAGILADDPDGETITALGGTTWLALWEHLARSGRRPLSLTTNPRVTLAGTLGVGGVGDTSHQEGPQVSGVRRLVLVTPDGERRVARPGDPYFAHALCGHGQLGAITEVTLATTRMPSTITGRIFRWGSLPAALDDLGALARQYPLMRPRVVWGEGLTRLWAVAGAAGTVEDPLQQDATHILSMSPAETFDLLAHARVDPSAGYAPHNPVVEIVVPYPAGIPTILAIDDAIARGPLLRYLPRGSSLQLVAGTRDLPLSPFAAPMNIVFAIRPEVATRDAALACEPPLRALANLALAAGGHIYLASFRVPRPPAPQLAALRLTVDPHDLCNRDNLHGDGQGYSSPMADRLTSFTDFTAFLGKAGIPHRIDAENQIVELQTRPPALPTPLVVRWEKTIPYIQMMQQMIPQPAPEDRVKEIETALALVNDVAMIPGYGFNYGAKVVYYRMAIPLFDGIAPESLDKMTAAVMNNAAQLSGAFQAVVGGTPGADVLKTLAASRTPAS